VYARRGRGGFIVLFSSTSRKEWHSGNRTPGFPPPPLDH